VGTAAQARGAVLVTGAAGRLGKKLVERLAPAWPVVAVDRSPPRYCARGVRQHVLDLTLPGAEIELKALAGRASVAVHLAWEPKASNNLTLTRQVLNALSDVGLEQLVHVSSATVYGAWPDNPVPLTEDNEPRPNPEFTYAVHKRAAEVVVQRWSAEHPGTKLAVLRPACTVGGAEQPLCQLLTAPKKPSLGPEPSAAQFLHVDDLAEAVLHALVSGLEGTYNVAPDTGVPAELATAVAAGSTSLPTPVRALLAAWGWRSSRRAYPAGAGAYARHPWVVSPGKLQGTGWVPQYSSTEALLVTDDKDRWDDLPQGRRVAITLAGTGMALVVAGAGGAAIWRRKR